MNSKQDRAQLIMHEFCTLIGNGLSANIRRITIADEGVKA